MRDRNRIRNILAAGLLTGLVLATIVAFGWRDIRGTEAAPIAGQSDSSLESENELLRQAVEQLQAREASYQAEIEAANENVRELQASTLGARRYDDDDEEYEEHEDDGDHEEREHDDDDGWWDND